MWVTVRKMIRWQPFMQNYKKEYPWIQLAGHTGGLVNVYKQEVIFI